MKENKKDLTLQIRITLEERQMLQKLREANSDFNVSSLFRAYLKEYYIKNVPENGIGTLTVG